jgi:hypothetical protein
VNARSNAATWQARCPPGDSQSMPAPACVTENAPMPRQVPCAIQARVTAKPGRRLEIGRQCSRLYDADRDLGNEIGCGRERHVDWHNSCMKTPKIFENAEDFHAQRRHACPKHH